MSISEVILYTSHYGRICLKLKTLENTVWLTQPEIAELFGKARSTIAEHISAIFDDGELESTAVCRKFRQTAEDGKLYDVIHYNLDISAQVAEKLVLDRYEEFDGKRRKAEQLMADSEDKATLRELQAMAQAAEAVSKKT
jgi:hypothetical protein